MMATDSKWELPLDPEPYVFNDRTRNYNFPKIDVSEIEKADLEAIQFLTAFWETDFEVEDVIYPKMADWERLNRVPPTDDRSYYKMYQLFKDCYGKWQECNKNYQQFAEKYQAYNNLMDVLNHKPRKTMAAKNLVETTV